MKDNKGSRVGAGENFDEWLMVDSYSGAMLRSGLRDM